MALLRVARPMERQYICSVSKKMGPLGLSPGPKRFLQEKKQKRKKLNSRSSTGAMKGQKRRTGISYSLGFSILLVQPLSSRLDFDVLKRWPRIRNFFCGGY